MTAEEFQKIINSIQEKLGEENSSKVADDLGLLITNNTEQIKTISTKDSEIKTLNKDKEMLTSANGKLLQQISILPDREENTKKEEEDEKEFDFSSLFDKHGMFKKE